MSSLQRESGRGGPRHEGCLREVSMADLAGYLLHCFTRLRLQLFEMINRACAHDTLALHRMKSKVKRCICRSLFVSS